MKKQFTLLIAASVTALATLAEPVKVGNLWYEILDEDAKTAEIVRNPDDTPYAGVQNSWFATSVTINGATYAVETVGERAFEGATMTPYENSSGVASIYMIGIPMKVIKKDAFKDITSTAGNKTGCRFITSRATANPSGTGILTYVEPGAFRGAQLRGFVCTGNTRYTNGKDVAFTNGPCCLYDAENCEIVAVTATVKASTSSGSNGLYGGNATSVTFGSDVKSVADYAFWTTTSLQTITMNEGLERIGKQAFYGNTALTTTNIPSTVTGIAADAFEGCDKIATLTVNCDLTDGIKDVVFDDAVYTRILENGGITFADGVDVEAYKNNANWGRFFPSEVAESVALTGVEFTEGHNYSTWYGEDDLAVPAGLTAYVVSAVSGDAATITAVDYIPANTGVLLYSDTEASDLTAEPCDGATDAPTSLLVGYTDDTAITDGYLLWGDTFYRALTGTLPAHRCYLPVPEGESSPVSRVRLVKAGGVVTGIADVNAAQAGRVTYVSVTGQVSDSPFSGVNICVTRHADGTVTTAKIVK